MLEEKIQYFRNRIVVGVTAAVFGLVPIIYGCGSEVSDCCQQVIVLCGFDEDLSCKDISPTDSSTYLCLTNSEGEKECCKTTCDDPKYLVEHWNDFIGGR